MRLPFEDKAAEELEAVAQFYEQERAGYGRLFLVEVSKKVARAADFPKSGARVPGTAEDRDVRAFVLSKFPYTVVTAFVSVLRTSPL
jgi:plasmid stabilization system protein ParE